MKMRRLVLMAMAVAFAVGVSAQTWSKELLKKAEGGDAKAQCDVGIAYINGEGTDPDCE